MKKVFVIFLCVIIIVTAEVIIITRPEEEQNTPVTCSSEQVRAKIRDFEGFNAHAVWDVWAYSIGYGHTALDVAPDATITEEEALVLFNEDIKRFDEAVLSFAEANDIEFTQNEFDALVSFLYNLGANALERYKDEPLVKYLVTGDYTAEEMIAEWTAYCHSEGEVVPGLVARRNYEVNLFLYGTY